MTDFAVVDVVVVVAVVVDALKSEKNAFFVLLLHWVTG